MTTIDKCKAWAESAFVENENEREAFRQAASELEALRKSERDLQSKVFDLLREREALQHKVTKLKAFCDDVEGLLQAERNKNQELNAEADKEHAKAVELCDKLIEERRRNQELRKALEAVLASACPHPMEHGIMYEAWQTAKQALALQP